VRAVKKAIKLLRTIEHYEDGRYLDRYIVASIFLETGKPLYLADKDIRCEVSEMRKAAVVSREVANITSFIDWDICIYNYLELNSKEGYQSRVVRQADA